MRGYLGMAVAIMLLSLMGCGSRSQPRQQVAGEQEQYRSGTPTTVTMTFTDDGMTINPSRIPTGDVQLRLVNNSSRDQTLVTSGDRGRAARWTLRKGQTVTTSVRNSEPGFYRVSTPSGSTSGRQ